MRQIVILEKLSLRRTALLLIASVFFISHSAFACFCPSDNAGGADQCSVRECFCRALGEKNCSAPNSGELTGELHQKIPVVSLSSASAIITGTFDTYDCVDYQGKPVKFQRYFELKTGIHPEYNHGAWDHRYGEEIATGLDRLAGVTADYQTCIANYVIQKSGLK